MPRSNILYKTVREYNVYLNYFKYKTIENDGVSRNIIEIRNKQNNDDDYRLLRTQKLSTNIGQEIYEAVDKKNSSIIKQTYTIILYNNTVYISDKEKRTENQ